MLLTAPRLRVEIWSDDGYRGACRSPLLCLGRRSPPGPWVTGRSALPLLTTRRVVGPLHGASWAPGALLLLMMMMTTRSALPLMTGGFQDRRSPVGPLQRLSVGSSLVTGPGGPLVQRSCVTPNHDHAHCVSS